MTIDLNDITPTTPRNPFAPGADVPMSVETRNSTYTVEYLPLTITDVPSVLVTCERGTFEGQSWIVRRAVVVLSRNCFYVGDDAGLTTTRPLKVNGLPVETWD